MRNLVSRTVALTIMLAIILSTFACAGQSQTNTSSSTASDKKEAPAASSKSEPAAKSEAKPDAKTEAKASIKLGYMGPLTGVASELGNETKRGIELAVDEINAQGGVDGHKIELISEDDQGDPAKGVAIAQKFVSKDNVDAVIGSAHSAVSLAVMEVTKAAKIVQFSPTNSLDKLTEVGNPYYFRLSSRDSDFAKFMVDFAAKKYKKIAILHDTTAWGQGGRDAYIKVMEASGIKPVTIQSFEMGAPDQMPQVLNIQKAGADAILVQAQGPDAAQTLKTLRQINYSVPVVGHPGLALRSFANLSKELGEGTIIVDEWDPSKPATQKLVDAYKKKYNNEEPFGWFPLGGYDTIMIVTKALKNANFDKTKLKDALEQIKNYETISGQVGVTVSLSPESHEGMGLKGPVVKVLKSGKMEILK